LVEHYTWKKEIFNWTEIKLFKSSVKASALLVLLSDSQCRFTGIGGCWTEIAGHFIECHSPMVKQEPDVVNKFDVAIKKRLWRAYVQMDGQ
jgi:uncharacterized Fe-S cluster-containing MiaB family protein